MHLSELPRWRAAQLLKWMERAGGIEAPAQMRLFQISDSRIRERLHQIDVTMLTPIEAMNVLHGLVEEAKK